MKCILQLGDHSRNALLLLQLPLVCAICHLIAFKTVQLVFSTKVEYWDNDLQRHDNLEIIVHDISCALEPALGSLRVHSDSDDPYYRSQYVVFVPRVIKSKSRDFRNLSQMTIHREERQALSSKEVGDPE